MYSEVIISLFFSFFQHLFIPKSFYTSTIFPLFQHDENSISTNLKIVYAAFILTQVWNIWPYVLHFWPNFHFVRPRKIWKVRWFPLEVWKIKTSDQAIFPYLHLCDSSWIQPNLWSKYIRKLSIFFYWAKHCCWNF